MKNALCLMFLIVLCAGCSKGPAIEANDWSKEKSKPIEIDGIEISAIGDFDDSTAYCGYRRVFRLRDKRTGTEWIGVSGVGISEVGAHVGGKSARLKDER